MRSTGPVKRYGRPSAGFGVIRSSKKTASGWTRGKFSHAPSKVCANRPPRKVFRLGGQQEWGWALGVPVVVEVGEAAIYCGSFHPPVCPYPSGPLTPPCPPSQARADVLPNRSPADPLRPGTPTGPPGSHSPQPSLPPSPPTKPESPVLLHSPLRRLFQCGGPRIKSGPFREEHPPSQTQSLGTVQCAHLCRALRDPPMFR